MFAFRLIEFLFPKIMSLLVGNLQDMSTEFLVFVKLFQYQNQMKRKKKEFRKNFRDRDVKGTNSFLFFFL